MTKTQFLLDEEMRTLVDDTEQSMKWQSPNLIQINLSGELLLKFRV